MPADQPIYPTQRAFVVQVHVDADVVHGQIYGRTEHIVSGQSKRFQTADELLRFIVQVLATEDEDSNRSM